MTLSGNLTLSQARHVLLESAVFQIYLSFIFDIILSNLLLILSPERALTVPHIGPRAASHSALSPLSSAAFCAFSDNVRATTPKIDSDHATPATVAVVKGVTKLLTVADTLRAVIEAATISSASRSVC
mgnify:CR=1 FL=1